MVKGDDPRATLSPTALVNEAFLKLAAAPRFKVMSPLHFRRIVGRAMRQVLVEAARRRNATKRGKDLIKRHPSSRCSAGRWSKRFDEAGVLLQRALGIQGRLFGTDHPRVASAVNDLGNIAVQTGRPDDAEAAFTRMGNIYRKVYGGKHFLIATATSMPVLR